MNAISREACLRFSIDALVFSQTAGNLLDFDV